MFISTIIKSLYNISKKNSHILCDLSYLSQAYVFYKFSQTQINAKKNGELGLIKVVWLKIKIENDSKLYSLSNEKDNLKKCYGYGLLAYKSINYENKSDSFFSRLPFEVQVKKNLEISYNSNTSKHNFVDMPSNLHINNYLRKGNILDRERNLDRNYFDWKIIHFSLRQKGDIEAWVKIDTNSNPNTKIGISNYRIIDQN
uniref:Uncharacterized protein n=1 Tax=Solanum lycopersicum TaxID=4081 RepID=K4D775_SOLLC